MKLRAFFGAFRRGPASVIATGSGMAVGRDLINSHVTINDNAEVLRAIAELQRKLSASGLGAVTPAAEARTSQAVGEIARGAAAGDERLATAMDLLRAGQTDAAIDLLQAEAVEKKSLHQRSGKEAATAYRTLGGIAGLADPAKARMAYQEAVALDPDDVDSLLWLGWIELDYGDLAAAERRFRAVLARANQDTKVWHAYWARLGLGDLRQRRGALHEAMAEFQGAAAVAERLAKADPANAGWQRDLSVSYDRIGDVQREQGDLPAALASFQASLSIRERLANADPANAGWQRDLAISHERIGDMLDAERDRTAAIAAFEQARVIYTALLARNPDYVPGRVAAVVPLWRLGRLKGRDGRVELEAALAILRPLAAAGHLDANRRRWIGEIEHALAALQ